MISQVICTLAGCNISTTSHIEEWHSNLKELYIYRECHSNEQLLSSLGMYKRSRLGGFAVLLCA
jgi:hypothetical protein